MKILEIKIKFVIIFCFILGTSWTQEVLSTQTTNAQGQSSGNNINPFDKKKLIFPAIGLGFSFFYLRKKEKTWEKRESALLQLLETTKNDRKTEAQLKKKLAFATRKKNMFRLAKIAGFTANAFFFARPFINHFDLMYPDMERDISWLAIGVAMGSLIPLSESDDFNFDLKTETYGNVSNENSWDNAKEHFYPDKSKWKVIRPNEIEFKIENVSMTEVVRKGLDDLSQFIKNKEKFAPIKNLIPKGIIFTGPPGCGKTLTAKAYASYLGFNFIEVTGSEFVHTYVGTGTFAMKSLFEKARENAPCLIFIDEIDAVARKRDAAISDGGTEYEKTLNQLLFELDGRQVNNNWDEVLVFGATNFIEAIDKALLRPGRLGKVLEFELPNIRNRTEILKINLEKLNINLPEADILMAAKHSAGMSGAQIKDIVTKACIDFLKKESNGKIEKLSTDYLAQAIETVQLGEPKDELFEQMSHEMRRRVALHESGHALASFLVEKTPLLSLLSRITIIPRVGGALGLTSFVPESEADMLLQDREELERMMMVSLGGMAAEKIFFNNSHSSGVSSDLISVNRVAKQIITRFGMSELGPIMVSKWSDASGTTQHEIEKLSRELVNRKLKELIELFSIPKNKESIEKLANTLLEKKTLDRKQVLDILELGVEQGEQIEPQIVAPHAA